jgi:hypothetical protein
MRGYALGMNSEADNIPHDVRPKITFKRDGVATIHIGATGSGYYNPYTHRLTMEKARRIEVALGVGDIGIEDHLAISERVIEILSSSQKPDRDAAWSQARAEFIMRIVNGDDNFSPPAF